METNPILKEVELHTANEQMFFIEVLRLIVVLNRRMPLVLSQVELITQGPHDMNKDEGHTKFVTSVMSTGGVRH